MFANRSIFRFFSILLIVIFILASTPLQAAHAAGICFVKWNAGGANTGASWADAYTTLQSALGSPSCTEIWVAAGTYKPTSVTTNRDATFQLKNGVALYGGFAGTETLRSERNPATNLSILSGDIDNDDSQTPIITNLATVTGNTTNSYHVVTGATNATLDGFIITAGNADTSGNVCPGTGCGGGMYNFNANPTLTNIIFSGNSSYTAGGGMINHSSSSPMLTNVTFSSNSQTYAWGSNGGGGMYNVTNCNPILTNVTFDHNSGYFGGGLFSQANSNPTLTNVTFIQNKADIGGGMHNSSSVPVLLNVTFNGNVAMTRGGGLNIEGGNALIRNTIFWGNEAPVGAQIYNGGGTNVVSDSVVQGGYADGTNILTTDPKLGALGNYGGFTQTVPILAGSSAIDTGNDTTCATTDQRGIIRPQGDHCDIGAFEQDDFIAPTVNTFTATTLSTTFSIPITAFSASDAVGVTGYLISTSATTPASDAASWTSAIPTTYKVSADGSYTLYPWAKDAAGNVSAVFDPPITVVVDTTAPTVNNFTATTPSTSLNIPITAFLATDTVGVTGYLISTSATTPASDAAGWTNDIPTTYKVSKDGSYTLYPWAKDAAGNVSAVFDPPITVVADTTAPIVVTFTAPTPSTSLNIPITAFLATDTVGVTGYLISTSDTAPASDAAGWTSTIPTTYKVTADGSYTLYPWAKDAAGNVSTLFASPPKVVVDATAPTVKTFTAPTLSANFNIPITAFNATDLNGVTGYLITYSSTMPGSNAAGWSSTAPTTYPVTADGSYSLYPWAKDAAGNVSAVFDPPITVVVDTTAPTVKTFTATTPSTSLSIPITAFSATDDGGVKGYLISTSATAPASDAASWTNDIPTTYKVPKDGSYTLYPWAKDAAGNVSAVFDPPITVVVDTTAPTVKTFTATTPSTSLSIPITAFSATDDGGVKGYLITHSSTVPGSNAAGWSSTAPTTYPVTSDGSYTLYPWAKDAAGNVSAVFDPPITVVVDTTAPTVSSITLADISPTSAANVHFTITFSESVTGVDVADFELATTGVVGALITDVTGSGSVYTVTVSSGSNNGSIRLDVPISATIANLLGNPLANLPFTGAETYTITKDNLIYLPLILK